ncbi:hypothetical protein [Epilithonimonas mollis]|uniref:Uncharacterized protein n=1 Tax=Epilithonimonas mollis TaxID=216903 RepID=A0A1M6UJ47_9FLAO|nr:hypothetical protein [Epilithonimonas mollis]SHK69196.1 hypothetical protein SAMN05444371_3318 [Epilithonimonas mollis]
MRKLKIKIKKLLLKALPKETIPFDDCGLRTELRFYKFFGKVVKVSQFVIPEQCDDEQALYLGIIK